MVETTEINKITLRKGVIEIVLGPFQSAASVLEIKETIDAFPGDRTYDILCDASGIQQGDGTGFALAKELIHKLPFRRFAIYGASRSRTNRSIKDLFDTANLPDKAKLFRQEEDARLWLTSKG
jgi:hypothetical protein